MKIQIFIKIILVSLLVTTLNSCELHRLFQRKKTEKLISSNTYHKFSFKRHIVFPTTFLSGENNDMALDLGAGSTMLIRNTGLEFIKPLKPIVSFGITRSADNKLVKNKYYSVGTISTDAFKLENAFISIIDNFQVSPCNNFSGIWGADTFNEKIIIIRMQDTTLAVLDSLPSLEGWTQVDAKYRYPHFFVNVTVGGRKMKLLFDTGCTSGIVMNQRDFNACFSKNNSSLTDERKFYGNNFVTGSGMVMDTSVIAEIEGLKIGDFQLSPVSITSSERIHSKVIGLEIMKQFNILLDYKNEKLYLQPNPDYHYTKTLNPYVRLGFSCFVVSDGNIEINSLQVGSPAEKTGLKIGDHIISINNIKAENGSNCEIIKTFSNAFHDENNNEIIIKRGEEILRFVI
jgi:predicted aspartyl protease